MLTFVEPLRRRAKSLQRTGRYPALFSIVRWLWNQKKSLHDLAYSPAILREIGRLSSTDRHALIDIVFDRFGGALRPIQNRGELEVLLARIDKLRPRTILEIGTAKGGTLLLLSRSASPDATLISIDLPSGMHGGGYPRWKAHLFRRFVLATQNLHLLRGNSHLRETYEKAVEVLRDKPVDLLFIDGDHSYSGVKQDYDQYRTLVRQGGLIVFHDILQNRFDPDIQVAKLWDELKLSHDVTEIVDDYDQGLFGIGVLTVREPTNVDAH
jgi:predicted O-methyltransferase YrrM